jgi:alpha,alpha-trehalase
MILKLNIKATLQSLLRQEDTDGDKKITIEDKGPKSYVIIAVSGENHEIKGTYFLSNLLQELVIAKHDGKEFATISLAHIEELPSVRISRFIKDYYWQGLTRSMDANGIEKLLSDTKNETLSGEKLKIYIPFKDDFAWNYYQQLENTLPLEAIRLPKKITPEYVKSINNQSGILALKLETLNKKIQGVPFVVPGGRFNEMYGWDSYFESVGLLLDKKVHLAIAMADNFQYQIEHYGKILNANRSYYLTRTQPPFYTSLIKEVFEITQDKNWLKSHLETVIKEYETVWMVEGQRLTNNGLNRYFAAGIGVPPECEKGHFDSIIAPFAHALKITVAQYLNKYNSGIIENTKLDAYFVHDRSVRESGHDTSYRIEGICADLNLVELNALLYKYEQDIGKLIQEQFDGSIRIDTNRYTPDFWFNKAEKRKQLANQFLWDDDQGLYVDFNFKTQTKSNFVAATTLVPLWANMASKKQAASLVKKALPMLKEKGGIAGTSQQSSGVISSDRPARQWDYPNGWAPHQMMIWKGLFNYGYEKEAQELIYRWLYMITKNAVEYNGTIPEKYDVVAASHKVFAEYGNVGTDFEYITQEGFGWMNASFKYGLSLLKKEYISKLDSLIAPENIF